jgi:hypothetical protein
VVIQTRDPASDAVELTSGAGHAKTIGARAASKILVQASRDSG